MALLRAAHGGEQHGIRRGGKLRFQRQQRGMGAAALQLFGVAGGKFGETLLRRGMIPAAQLGGRRNVFEPLHGGEGFFADAARVEAVAENGGGGGGRIAVDAADGGHGRAFGADGCLKSVAICLTSLKFLFQVAFG